MHQDFEHLEAATTAFDLQDKIEKLSDQYKINGMISSGRKIIESYVPPEMKKELESKIQNKKNTVHDFVLKDSIPLKSIIQYIGRDMNKSIHWDMSWETLFNYHNYGEFCKSAFYLKHMFFSKRNSYLMQQIFRNVSPNREKGLIPFSNPELLCEKYIDDIMEEDVPNSETPVFKIIYEDFDGITRKISVSPPSSLSFDDQEKKPKPYWIGNTIFDSIYMIPVFDYDNEIWIHVPVPLIKNFVLDQKKTWGNKGGDQSEF